MAGCRVAAPSSSGENAVIHMQIDRRNIPSSLVDVPQWVAWKVVRRNGHETKLPMIPSTGKPADSTDSTTWASFEQALGAFAGSRDLAGIGFVFSASDPFVGIDLDGCIIDGEIVAEARVILELLNSYSEVSPSGRGIKVFVQGRKPPHAGCRSDPIEGFDRIEVYDDKRFFTVTCNHVPGAPREVADRQAELDELCNRFWPLPTETATNQSINAAPSSSKSTPTIEMAAREAQCIAYLEKCPDAISGRGGHNATLRAACECHRFGLDEAAAWRVIRRFNDRKTGGERWSDKELDHKLDSARRKVETAGELGVRLLDLRADPQGMRIEQVAALATDIGNAARLVQRYGHTIRFCHGPQQWLTWDKRRWKTDNRGAIVKLCKQTALAILDEAERLSDEAQAKLLK